MIILKPRSIVNTMWRKEEVVLVAFEWLHLMRRCRCSRWAWPSRSRALFCAPAAQSAARPPLCCHPPWGLVLAGL